MTCEEGGRTEGRKRWGNTVSPKQNNGREFLVGREEGMGGRVSAIDTEGQFNCGCQGCGAAESFQTRTWHTGIKQMCVVGSNTRRGGKKKSGEGPDKTCLKLGFSRSSFLCSVRKLLRSCTLERRCLRGLATMHGNGWDALLWFQEGQKPRFWFVPPSLMEGMTPWKPNGQELGVGEEFLHVKHWLWRSGLDWTGGGWREKEAMEAKWWWWRFSLSSLGSSSPAEGALKRRNSGAHAPSRVCPRADSWPKHTQNRVFPGVCDPRVPSRSMWTHWPKVSPAGAAASNTRADRPQSLARNSHTCSASCH